MIRRILILLLLFTTLKPFAQKKYTLADCYQLARKNNIAIQKAQNLTRSNLIDLNSAQYRLLPSLSFNMGHYFSFGKNIDPVTNGFINENFSGGSMGVGLHLTVFSGFSSLYRIKLSKYAVEASEYARKRTELETFTNITLIFFRLLFDAEQSVEVRNNILKSIKELEIVQEKIKVGKVSKTEYYVLNARLHSEQADLVTVQNDSLTALQDLKQLLNISYTEEMDVASIDTSMISSIISSNITSADLIAMILQNHPAIRQARLNEQVARMSQKIAKSNMYPYLSVGGNLASNYNADQRAANGGKINLHNQLNNNLGQNIYISLQIPIFSQMEFVNNVKKEKINVSNSEYATKETENLIITNSVQLINDFNSVKEKYRATLSALEQNKLSYAIYEERYKLGQISSLELITAKDILNTSNSKYLQSKFELFFRYQLLELLKTDQ